MADNGKRYDKEFKQGAIRLSWRKVEGFQAWPRIWVLMSKPFIAGSKNTGKTRKMPFGEAGV